MSEQPRSSQVKFALENPAIGQACLLRAPVVLFVADNESEERRAHQARTNRMR